MKNLSRVSAFFALASAAHLVSPEVALSATITKADNTTSISTGSSWVGGIAPGTNDYLLFDSTIAGSLSTGNLSANFFTGGFQFTNPGGAITIGVSGSAGASTALTVGGANITSLVDMSAATQDVTFGSVVTGGQFRIASGMYGGITVASGRTLTFNANFNNQGNNKTIVMTGPGNIVFNGSAGGGTAFGFSIRGGANVTMNGQGSWGGTSSREVINGTLNIGNDSALGGTTLTMGGTSSSSPTLAATGAARTLSNNITLVAVTTNNAVVAGANALTVNGVLTVSGGNRTLTVNNSALTTFGTGGIALSEGATSRSLTLNGTGSVAVTGVISNGSTATASSLAYTGSGVLTLSAANTYAGGTTLGGGTLNIGNMSALGTGALTINGGTIDNTSGADGILAGNLPQTWGGNFGFTGTKSLDLGTGAVTLTGSRQVTVSANSLTVGGAISGAGYGLTKAGNGTLVLAANNSYSGPTIINGGTLVHNVTNTSTSVTVNSGASLAGSGSLGATTVSAGGTVSPGNSPGNLTVSSFALNAGGNYNWQLWDATGVAGVGYDSVTSSGAFDITGLSATNPFNVNLWTINSPSATSGNAINFTAGQSASWTLVSYGSLSGTFSTNLFAINLGAYNGTAGFSNPTNGAFSLALSGSSLQLVYTPNALPVTVWTNGSGNLSGSGIADGQSLVFAGAGGSVTNNSAVTSLASVIFSNSSSGSYTLRGTGFTNGGDGVANTSSSAQAVAADITLGADQSFRATSGNLAISGAVTNAGYTLTTSGASNVAISGPISGAGGLAVLGAGTTVLSGANTYTGNTVVTAGTLAISGSGTMGDATSAVTINGGAVDLGGGALANNSLTLSGGALNNGTASISQLTLASGSVGAVITGTNGLVKSIAGTVLLSGSNTYSGGTTISAGVLGLTNSGTLGDASSSVTVGGGTLDLGAGTLANTSLTVNSGLITNGQVSLDATAVALNGGTVGAALTGASGLTKSGSGTVTLSGANTYSGGTTISGGMLSLGGNDRLYTGGSVAIGSGATLNLGGNNQTVSGLTGVGSVTNTAGSLTVNVASGNNTFDGSVTGAGGLATAGGGTLTLTAAQAYTGTTAIGSGSTLSLASTGRLAAATAVANSGTLLLDGASITNNGGISGGAVIMSNSSVYTGLSGQFVNSTVTIPAGTTNLVQGTAGYVAPLAATTILEGGGRLNLGNSAANTTGFYANGTNFTGTVNWTGTSPNRLAGINIPNGTMLVTAGIQSDGGTVRVGALTGSGAFNRYASGGGSAALVVGANGLSGEYSGSIASNALTSLTKVGAGTQVLSGINAYTAATTVSAGKLVINGDNSAATGNVTIAAGAMLGGSGTIGGATTVNGIHSPGNSPGIQTFTNGITYNAGSTFVWELTVNGAGTRGITFDGVDVAGGTLTINTGVTSDLVFNASGSTVDWGDAFWDTAHTWLVFSNASAPTLASGVIFDTVSVGLDSTGATLAVARPGSSFSWQSIGNDIYANYAIPEPSTYALLGLAGAGALVARWRLRRRN